jgi:hypothetical protein
MALMFNQKHFKAIFNRGRNYYIEQINIFEGFAFDKLRLYDDAINDYTKAIELDHKNAFAYYNVKNK